MHIAQQMPLPLTISCSSKSRLVLPLLVLPFWYLLTWVAPDKFQKSSKTIVCVRVCVCVCNVWKVMMLNWSHSSSVERYCGCQIFKMVDLCHRELLTNFKFKQPTEVGRPKYVTVLNFIKKWTKTRQRYGEFSIFNLAVCHLGF